MKAQLEINSAFENWHLGLPDCAMGMCILNAIHKSQSENDLRQRMKGLEVEFVGFRKFFIYGFTRNTMWVKQTRRYRETENWITVYF